MKTLLFALLLAVSPAWGQDHVNVQAANRKVADVLKQDRQFFPQHWNVMVLDERTWNSYPKTSSTAFSMLDKHITALRAKYVITATPEEIDHTLRHEAGHAACNCMSEKGAEAFAEQH